MKKIMYFSYGGGHGNIVKCLYKWINGIENIEQKIVALTVSWRLFEESGVPYNRLGDYKSVLREWNVILETGKRLANDISFDNPDLLYDDYCVYLGIGYYSLVMEFGEEEAARLYRENGRQSFCPVYIIKEILKYEEPDAVIITCGVRTEKAAGIAANELGIPVLRIADLYEFEPSGCDAYTCVMNRYAKEYAINSLGIDEKKVFITGQPVFEENCMIDEIINSKLRQELKLENYGNVIIYLEQPGLKETKLIEDKLIKIAKERPKWLIILKKHPNQIEDLDYMLPSNVICLRKSRLNYLLYNSDLAITRDSTAGIEAVLFDKPLISTSLNGSDDSIPKAEVDFSVLGISYRLDSVDLLTDALDECLDGDNKISIELKKNRESFRNVEHASENIFRVISEAIIH